PSMSADWRDPKLLLDMLLASRDARSFVADSDKQALEESKVLQYALVRALQIIGEAARGVTQATRDAHPEIPWSQIVGMRHRLVHDYTRVDTDIVWTVVTKELDSLIRDLERIVPPED
ncbi:MAG TPA: DUF86 domain-containing protein, partial [Chloroflexota bacterium]|nr:DUF86 domain-containing protein [Chloroflexota bacterium]